MSYETWTDSSGHEHVVREIDDEYLVNIVAFVRRRLAATCLLWSARADAYAADAPDGAADAASHEAGALLELATEGDPHAMLEAVGQDPWKSRAAAVLDEADRRGLLDLAHPCCLGVKKHRPGCRNDR